MSNKNYESNFDEIKKELEEVSGLVKVSVEELFNERFMQKNTDFNSLDEFLEKSGYEIKELMDFESIPVDQLNSFVKTNTTFESWVEMLKKAYEPFIKRKTSKRFEL